MPNANPVIRAMTWGIIMEKLSTQVSRYLPKGDPFENRKEIQNELNRLKVLGPEGRRQMEKYISRDIRMEKYESNLEVIQDRIDIDKLYDFQRQISCVEKGMEYKPYGIFPFISIFDMDSESFRDAVDNLKDVDLYQDSNVDNKSMDLDKKLKLECLS